ncbi:hypothetical protein, variant 1 [Aphanomyces astaci]|uniref:C3H1-type domain-containing protein n=1 Tax=Aphanomyces astaci TaxID=112090 RepID=W4FBP0_APHAT|nr:hypothetical protein, variant 1 [Aphanomyces astaci]ETV64108.1 hypothetical protein, variant 1 [Aphanomyces astaci]RQM19253.1 hypothetical protein B5M09_012645 [Aphanomyces astaci]|eukprot:XP_009846407.1 hypothetical protein, variant 1 [Aphanomyces astaci]
MMALDSKMTPNFSNLLQLQHRGYAQMLQTFDGRVQEHETLTGVHPITGKITNKRKRDDDRSTSRPTNVLEDTLFACCVGGSNVLRDDEATERFLPLFHQAKTESDQAKLLVVLAATARDPARSSSVALFEAFGGMKIARQWLDTAVSYHQTSLLHLILVTLKALPLQLSTITDAKINEPIVQLRKTAANDHVKRAAQDLLKHWKTTFTEKPPSPPSSKGKAKPATDVLGKLLLKKQEANRLISKPKDSFVTNMVQNQLLNKKEVMDVVSSPTVALPTIARFDQVQSQPTAAGGGGAASTRRIKWADEHGAALTKIKLIESWRDLVLHSDKDDPSSPVAAGSFKDAKLREHAHEKFAFLNKQKEEATSRTQPVVTVPWRTPPPAVAIPEGVTIRSSEDTPEMLVQTNRTRKDVEWIVLGDEVPPENPEEWTPSAADLSLGPTTSIPLTDPLEDDEVPPPVAVGVSNLNATESALVQALGPLEKATLALLANANDQVVAQVYAEAQRNGRRIADARVLDIFNQHDRQLPHGSSRPPPLLSAPSDVQPPPPLLSNPVGGYRGNGRDGPSGYGDYEDHMGRGGYKAGAPYHQPPSNYGPPPQQSFNNGYNNQPGYGGGYPERGGRDGGYNVDGGGYGGFKGGYPDDDNRHRYPDDDHRYPDDNRYPDDHNRLYPDDHPRNNYNKRPQHDDMPYPSKRPAFGSRGPPPHGGGGPPSSTYKYKQVPCTYFNSPAGCGKGDACTFIHDDEARRAAGTKYAPRGGGPPFKGGPKPNYYGGRGGRGGAYR